MIIICIRLWFKLSIACMKLIAYAMYYTMLMLIEFARIIMDVFNKEEVELIMKLEDINFLKEIANDLILHANKNGVKLQEFVKEQEKKREKRIKRSSDYINKKRKENKLYGRSEKQLNYQKQVKIKENNFNDLD